MIDWNLAPEGAEELVQRGLLATWRRGVKIWDYNQQQWCDSLLKWKVIATRPTFAESITHKPTATQTKTAKDAVEHHKVWPSGDYKYLFFIDEVWTFSDKRLSQVSVCTREEFEACVNERDGEKWTHTYENYGQTHKCNLLNEGKLDKDGYYSAINDNGLYARPFKVKPIKPTISKAEAWDKLQYDFSPSIMYQSIIDGYDIT